MPIIETSRGLIAYAARGSEGPAIVFVHGAGGSYRHWGLVLGALPQRTRRYALDLPGHGRSPGPGRRSIADYGEDLTAFLDAMGLNQALVVGHSMGGAIALWLALERRQRVAGLGLIGSGGRLRVAPWLLEGVRQDQQAAIARVASLLYGPAASQEMLAATEQDLGSVEPEVLEGDYLACDSFDVLGRLHQIDVPAAVVCGALDRMTPPKYSEYMAARLGQARLTLLEGVGHMPMLEAPQETAQALVPLLDTSA